MNNRSLQNLRVMAIPATAANYYPTGNPLGVVDQAGTILDATDTFTNTAGSSLFANAQRSSAAAYLVGLNIVTGGSANATITIQSHGGTTLLQAINGETERQIPLYGAEIQGGFRVVTAGTTPPIVQLVYAHDVE